jgi:hypothetical protein
MARPLVEFLIRPEKGKARRAQVLFANVSDLNAIKRWRQQTAGPGNLLTEDALEFASEAAKKWMFCRRKRRTASEIATLKRRITTDKDGEVAFLLVVRAKSDQTRCLGIALCRRTWANHVVLDFLATHPMCLQSGPGRIAGIGKGLLFGICEIATRIRASAMWGEATADSAPKYQRIFRLRKADDLFYVPKRNLLAFRGAMSAQIKTERLRAK